MSAKIITFSHNFADFLQKFLIGSNAYQNDKNALTENEKQLVNLAKIGFYQLIEQRKICLEEIVSIIRQILRARSLYLPPVGISLDLTIASEGYRNFEREPSQESQPQSLLSDCPFCKQNFPHKTLSGLSGAIISSKSSQKRGLEKAWTKIEAVLSTEKTDAYFAENPKAFGLLLEALFSSSELARQHLINPNDRLFGNEQLNAARQHFVVFFLNIIRIEYTSAFYAHQQNEKQMHNTQKSSHF